MAKTRPRELEYLFVLLVMIVGGVLAFTWPVWIAPPNVSSTIWLYLPLLVLWFPVLIVVFVRQSKRSMSRFFLFLLVGVLITITVSALAGPNISVWAIEPKNCTSREVSPGQTEYTCTIWGILGHQIFTLQGATGSSFVRLMSDEMVDTQ